MNRHPGQGIDFETVVYAENVGTPGNAHSQRWPVVIGIVDGDWYDLAQRYRLFAQRQYWTANGPLRDRQDYPDWLADTGLIYASSIFDTTISELEAAMTQLGNAHGFDPRGHIFWHFTNWHDEGRIGQFQQSNDLPAFTIGQSFTNQVQSAKAVSTPLALYLLPTRWDIVRDGSQTTGFDLNQWNAFASKDDALLGRFQTLADVVKPPTQDDTSRVEIHYVLFDPLSAAWRGIYEDVVQDLSSENIDALYLDELSALNPVLSFGSLQLHPPGGGDYWAEGYRAMLEAFRNTSNSVRRSMSKPPIAFYSEGFAESYIDLMDGFLPWNLDRGGTSPLPLAMAVYHDYTQFIGRTSWIGGLSTAGTSIPVQEDQIQFAVARSGQMFTWGGMPGFLFGLLSTGHSGVAHLREYMIELARWRRVFQDHLVYGRMMAPPEVGLLEANASLGPEIQPLLGRPRTDKVTHFEYPGALRGTPRIVSSAWASENPDGMKTVGVVVASLEAAGFGNNPPPRTNHCDPCLGVVEVDGSAIASHLGLREGFIHRVDLDGARTLVFNRAVALHRLQALRVRMEPEKVVLIEISEAR